MPVAGICAASQLFGSPEPLSRNLRAYADFPWLAAENSYFTVIVTWESDFPGDAQPSVS